MRTPLNDISKCRYCGASFSSADFQKPDCPYCGKVRALPDDQNLNGVSDRIEELLADRNGNGVPDIAERTRLPQVAAVRPVDKSKLADTTHGIKVIVMLAGIGVIVSLAAIAFVAMRTPMQPMIVPPIEPAPISEPIAIDPEPNQAPVQPTPTAPTMRENKVRSEPRRALAPKVDVATPAASAVEAPGPTSAEIAQQARAWAQRVVDKRAGSFQGCINDERKLNPQMAIEHQLAVHFDRSARVRRVDILSSGTSASLAACLRRTAERMVVPDDAPAMPDSGTVGTLTLR